MKTTIKSILAILLSGLLFSACEAMLDQVNPNKATDATFWKNEADFNLALTSCYTPLKNALNYYGTRGVMVRIVRSDEISFRSSAVPDINILHRFTTSNANAVQQGMFYQFYNTLYRTNMIMQKLEEKKGQFTQDFQNTVTGECLFIRGFYLFQLGKEFKDAPLRLIASQDPTTFPIEKSSQAEIWTQAKKDLAIAANTLPITNKRGKPTSGAAWAMLGKIHVYEKNWQEAIKVLEPLTQSPYTYKLADEFTWNFDETHENENNPESIFELLVEDLGGTDLWGDGENVNSTQSNTRPVEWAAPEVGGWQVGWVSNHFMNILLKEKDKNDEYDYRARTSVAWDYPGCMYYMKPFRESLLEANWKLNWILKYQNSRTQTRENAPEKSFINERAIRYAEVLMLLAEAYLNQNNLDKSIDYINQIRKRANLNDYSGAKTNEAVFEDLVHQKAIEFFLEGERFYDLRRWGMLDEAIKMVDPQRYENFKNGEIGNTNKYYYLPIPLKELNTNPLCTPSEGW